MTRTRIYLVRHGQTEWNRQERFRGRIDIPLNETGQRQAELVAVYLREKSVAAVYTSPLQRALQTAWPIAQAHNLSPTVLSGIVDIDYGEWQGLSPAEVRQRHPDLLDRWYSVPHLVQIPGGESLENVRSRALAALHAQLNRSELQMSDARSPEGIVLVTHQIVIKVLVCALLGLDNSHIWRIQQDNACIDIFDWDGSHFTAILVNGTDHLRDLI
jgi:broad specificity phosphatase PhoE